MTDLIGKPKDQIDTPALLVDLDLMEQNIERMKNTIIKEAGVNWRPHTKAMKTPVLAKRLLDAGAHGITCAKLGEAEVMAAGGIDNILIANQIVGNIKVRRLVELRKKTEVIVAVDSRRNVDELSAAATEAGVTLGVLIETDLGMGRAGLIPWEPVLELARHIADRPGLHFAGLMGWESHACRIEDQDEKRAVITEALDRFTEAAEKCREAGVPCDILSCGGTGTYQFSSFHPGITEIQAGGGIYGDVMYRDEFRVLHPCALTIIATVTSRPAPNRIVCDAGRKTLSARVEPDPVGLPQVESAFFSAEHGTFELKDPSETPLVGDRFEMIVGYSDVTVALHDHIIATRKGVVEEVWPLLGRGKLQ
jgi:D-serine deaminase-like pyridoxal phosphate-dependent protein